MTGVNDTNYGMDNPCVTVNNQKNLKLEINKLVQTHYVECFNWFHRLCKLPCW